MIDVKLLLEQSKFYQEKYFAKTNCHLDIKKIANLISEKTKLIQIIEQKNHYRNLISKEISNFYASKNINKEKIEEFKLSVTENNRIIDLTTQKLKTINKELFDIISYIPNWIDDSVIRGKNETNNRVIRSWNAEKIRSKTPHHQEILKQFNYADFKQTTFNSGPRFVTYLNQGSTLLRALINYLLEQNINAGYNEVSPPLVVDGKALFGTGQLPKFINDTYQLKNDQFLISTGEISLVNHVANRLFLPKQLPLKLTTYTPCFRKEAGAAGKDTKGIIRLHQFNKVEIVSITTPDQSYDVFESMIGHVEKLVQSLDIPYRIVELCSGDTGFSAAKTYDLEIWMPSQQKYVELSSCSNCTDFQARRLNIKYKLSDSKGKSFVHTLNASALAVDRLLANNRTKLS